MVWHFWKDDKRNHNQDTPAHKAANMGVAKLVALVIEACWWEQSAAALQIVVPHLLYVMLLLSDKITLSVC